MYTHSLINTHTHTLPPQINNVMRNHIATNGSFLLRPSSTSQDQYTLAVSHSRKILNFKINMEGGHFFIAPKRKFDSKKALLDYYRSCPIKSKRCGDEKILLLHPIPVDSDQEARFKQQVEGKGGGRWRG